MAPPRRPQKPAFNRRTAKLLLLFCGLPAALVIALKLSLVAFTWSSAEPPSANAAPQPAEAPMPAADGPDMSWSRLEPAYRSYKVAIEEDSSLKLNGRPARLFGFTVLPRSKICTYANGGRWACGQRAYVALINLMGSTTIDCQEMDTGAPVDIDTPRAYSCRLPGTDLAELMLKEGWGTTEPAATTARYLEAAAAARQTGAGMWRTQPAAQ